MGREIECRVEFVDGFILIQVDDVLNECFVKMIFDFVDYEVESVFKRRDNGNVKKSSFGCAAR